MRKPIALTLILTLACPLIFSSHLSLALEMDSLQEILTARERNGGGNRGGGNRANRSADRGSRNINRSSMGASGSGRVNRDRTVNRDINRDRTGNRDINRDQARDRVNNIDRDNVRNRVDNNRADFDLNNDRNLSNRVNRNIINTGDRTVIVNPRGVGWGGSAWGWNRGVVWSPNYGYWGGGFWGGVAVGAVATGVTTAIINAANQPDYIVIQQDSPGYTLFDSYGLTQVRCLEDDSQVYVYGPQDSLICAIPNNLVRAGYYDVDTETLVLIAR
jgi:hypothetical protein